MPENARDLFGRILPASMTQAQELVVERSSDGGGEGVDEGLGILGIEEFSVVDEIAGFMVWDGRRFWTRLD